MVKTKVLALNKQRKIQLIENRNWVVTMGIEKKYVLEEDAKFLLSLMQKGKEVGQISDGRVFILKYISAIESLAALTADKLIAEGKWECIHGKWWHTGYENSDGGNTHFTEWNWNCPCEEEILKFDKPGYEEEFDLILPGKIAEGFSSARTGKEQIIGTVTVDSLTKEEAAEQGINRVISVCVSNPKLVAITEKGFEISYPVLREIRRYTPSKFGFYFESPTGDYDVYIALDQAILPENVYDETQKVLFPYEYMDIISWGGENDVPQLAGIKLLDSG